MKNKKGFTLIELLAVIIILGILMIIAIPSVTSYINSSRKNAYVDTLKQVVSEARNMVNKGDYEMFSQNTTWYIPFTCINTENSLKTPYGDFRKAYIGVTFDGKSYSYYVTSVDETGHGIKEVKEASEIEAEDIANDIKEEDIKADYVIGNGTILKVFNADCTGFEKDIEIERPEIAVLYGFNVYQDGNYTLTNIDENNGVLKTTSNNGTINFSGLSKYTNIRKVVITMNEGLEEQTEIKVKSNNEVIGETTAQANDNKIEIVIDKGTYESIDLLLGNEANKEFDIEKIEVLTEDANIWSNQDITIYVDVENNSGNLEVSYDNGKTWSTDFEKEYTGNESSEILVRTGEHVTSVPTGIEVKIDKEVPSARIKATNNRNEEISTATWTNSGLNFTISETTENASGTHIYYCKDSNGTCTPNTEIESGAVITGFNNLIDTYFLRYTIVSNAGASDGIRTYYAKVEQIKPECEFQSLNVTDIGSVSTLILNCTDQDSKIIEKDLTASSFEYNNKLTVQSVTKETIENGYRYRINLLFNDNGEISFKLKGNQLEDNAGNKNDETPTIVIGQRTLTMSFDGNQGSGTTNAVSCKITTNLSCDVALPENNFTRKNYEFQGWATTNSAASGDSNGTIVTITGNTTRYATWKKVLFTIQLNATGGTLGTSTIYELRTIGWYSDEDATNSITTIIKPTRTGYTFDGYFTEENGNGTKIIDKDGIILSNTSSVFNENDTIHAKWILNSNTLTINPNGGKVTFNGAERTSSTSVTQNYNTTITIPSTGSRDNFIDTSSSYTVSYNSDGASTTPDNQSTLITKTTTYTFKNLTDSGDCGDTSGTTYRFPSGSSTTCTKNVNWNENTTQVVDPITLPSAPTKTGFRFDGWKSSTDNEVYAAGTSYTPTEDTTMTAQWTDLCSSTTDRPSCGGYGSCNWSGCRSRTCTHKYYSTIDTSYLCSTGSNYSNSVCNCGWVHRNHWLDEEPENCTKWCQPWFCGSNPWRCTSSWGDAGASYGSHCFCLQ